MIKVLLLNKLQPFNLYQKPHAFENKTLRMGGMFSLPV
jgi:hypothetical protein